VAHPGAIDSFPYGDGAGAKIQNSPMSMEPMNPGVDVRIAQLGPGYIYMVISR
jgi:hypothetical protein